MLMTRLSSMALLFIVLTIAFTVAGQLLVKQGVLEVGTVGGAGGLPRLVLRAITNVKVVLGLALAVLAAISWLVALSRSDLSFAYPFMGLAIVLVLALSGLIFDERVPITRWLGLALVCAGLWLSSRG
jgi:multidrug transporter EmrE-like cation transporter